MGYHPLSLLLLLDVLNRVYSLWSSNMRLARLPCTTAKGERLGFYELLAIFPRRIFLILSLLPAPIRAEKESRQIVGSCVGSSCYAQAWRSWTCSPATRTSPSPSSTWCPPPPQPRTATPTSPWRTSPHFPLWSLWHQKCSNSWSTAQKFDQNQ